MWAFLSTLRVIRDTVRGHSDKALVTALDPLEQWAYRLGGLFPNETRPRR